jgi:hypothetical protein
MRNAESSDSALSVLDYSRRILKGQFVVAVIVRLDAVKQSPRREVHRRRFDPIVFDREQIVPVVTRLEFPDFYRLFLFEIIGDTGVARSPGILDLRSAPPTPIRLFTLEFYKRRFALFYAAFSTRLAIIRAR